MLKKMENLKQTKQMHKGFTLVETLIAISIFSVSILGLMSVLSSSVANITFTKNKVIATYLAQEGVEYIRNMRDTFVVYDATNSQTGWNSFKNKITTASCTSLQGCYFNDLSVLYTDHLQPMTNLPMSACSASCPYLLYDNSTGKYNYVSGVKTIFIRKIFINQISPNEARVFSTVSWVENSGNQSVSFSESLFNWVE